MTLPFTIRQFLDVFALYNRAIGPMPLVLAAVALVAVALAFAGTARAGRAIALVLGGLWAWTGIVYHIVFFSRINTLAFAFGALFLGQAFIFLRAAVVRRRLRFRPCLDARGVTGGALQLYALAIYPLMNVVFGHAYPNMPTFGAPCPTTIFTIGLVFWLAEPWPKTLLAGPVLWAVIGGTAAFLMGMREDYGLLVAGVLAVVLAALPVLRRLALR